MLLRKNKASSPPPEGPETPSEPRRRATWTPPRLVAYGDLRELTMGPTPGVGESGPSGVRRLPT